MKIKNLKINSFGKLHNVEINLTDNINIIHGNNESGKSTILKFILNSFYGSSKNKKGKDISDFEKFKPWSGEDFSGKLQYNLDNGEIYEIYREFNKKNPKIFNEKLEDISKQFNINKKGNEFFFEQTKIDEELFLSTSAIIQQEVKIEKNMQTTLIQKIANLVGTGDDNVSYKRAIERLNRRQLDEIGTERSREKPINIIEDKMEKIKEELKELENFEQSENSIDQEKEKILEEITNSQTKFELAKEIKKLNDKQEIEKEKINIQEKIQKENNNKINQLENELNEIKIKNKKEEEINKEKIKTENKKINKKLNIYLLIIIIINILQLLIIKNKIFNISFTATIAIYLIYYFNKKIKLKNNKFNKTINTENNENKLEDEINLLQKNKNNLENEINKLKNDFNLKLNLEKQKIKNNYSNKIEEKEINNLINSKEINYLLDNLQNEINNNKIKLHSLELNKKNIEEKLERKLNLEENMSVLSEQYVNLQKLNSSMNLAKEVLKSSYEEMKETVTPKFTEQLSNTISEITNREIYECKI